MWGSKAKRELETMRLRADMCLMQLDFEGRDAEAAAIRWALKPEAGVIPLPMPKVKPPKAETKRDTRPAAQQLREAVQGIYDATGETVHAAHFTWAEGFDCAGVLTVEVESHG